MLKKYLPHTRARLAAAAAVAIAGAAAAPACCGAAAAPSLRLEKVVTIPGSATGWDYNSLDQQHGHIFIAHRKDGLQVYDVASGKVLQTVADSANANTSALAPEFDLGIAGTTDGYIVVFSLSSLKTLARYKSDTDGFDGAAYDPVSKRFAVVGEADLDKKRTPVLFFDARTGKPAGAVSVASVKIDAPRADGMGNIYMPLRDQASVLKVDTRDMKVVGTIRVNFCVKPSALELDNANRRLFVGCRGNATIEPVLAVLDVVSGRQVTTLPIGRGVDEVMYNRRTGSIFTANGDDASMTLIRQITPDAYRVAETVGTRPMARTGVLDERSGKIYLVNAEYVKKYRDGKDPETLFVPNTFSVLTYAK
jgi:hypothetical protein